MVRRPVQCQRLSTLRWDRLPPSRPSTKSGARAGGRRLSDRRLHRWLAGTSASAPSSHGAADLLGLNRAHICVRNQISKFKAVWVDKNKTVDTKMHELLRLRWNQYLRDLPQPHEDYVGCVGHLCQTPCTCRSYMSNALAFGTFGSHSTTRRSPIETTLNGSFRPSIRADIPPWHHERSVTMCLTTSHKKGIEFFLAAVVDRRKSREVQSLLRCSCSTKTSDSSCNRARLATRATKSGRNCA